MSATTNVRVNTETSTVTATDGSVLLPGILNEIIEINDGDCNCDKERGG